jgi:ATP-dependent Clp protease adaptor protein ClpS
VKREAQNDYLKKPIYQRNPMSAEPETITPVKRKKKKAGKEKSSSKLIPRYNVVLLDDNDHTYEYVIEMLTKLFGHSRMKAFKMACEVDFTGRVIVYTTTKERAEFKRDQIHAYGADWRIPRCQGSMSAIIEPAEPES